MEPVKVGQLIGEGESVTRDAIHVAIAPAIAGCDLWPGQPVVMFDQNSLGAWMTDLASRPELKPIGVVDPFLNGFVAKGQRFWLFLYPGTVTSLRHYWTHPAFTRKGD
jgi:hypothetical protein